MKKGTVIFNFVFLLVTVGFYSASAQFIGGSSFTKNHKPIDIQLSSYEVEAGLKNTTIGYLRTIDTDLNDSHKYELVKNHKNSSEGNFQILPIVKNSYLSKDKKPSYALLTKKPLKKGKYVVKIKTTDKGGLSFIKDLTVSVVNPADNNSAPSDIQITLNNPKVTADMVGVEVGSLTAVDDDLFDSHMFELVNGANANHNDHFEIRFAQGKFRVYTVMPLGVDRIFSIRVKATDSHGATFTRDLGFSSEENEAPSDIQISLIHPKVIADAVGVKVGNLLAVDGDANDTHSFELVNGANLNHNDHFEIRFIRGGDFALFTTIPLSVDRVYSVRVRVTDNHGATFTRDLGFASEENEAPTDILLPFGDRVAANRNGVGVSKLEAVDADNFDTHTFALINGANSNHNDHFEIYRSLVDGQMNYYLKVRSDIQLRAGRHYVARVIATDNHGATFTKDITVYADGDNSSRVSGDSKAMLSIYPNPTTGKVSVSQKSNANLIKVYSISGEVVYQKELNGFDTSLDLDLSKESKGLYFVELSGKDFKSSKKLVLK